MTGPRIDPETLAAFIDGTLVAEERARVLTMLAASPADQALVLEATQVAAALEAKPVTPLRPARRLGGRMLVIGLAAVMLAAVGLGRLRSGSLPSVVSLAATVSAPSGTEWASPAWTVVRGGADILSDRAATFRIGSRIADLEISARSSDTATARVAARDVARLLSGIAAGGPAAARFEQLSVDAGAVSNSKLRTAAVKMTRSLVGSSPWLDAAGWLEAARVSVMATDTTFFAPRGKAQSVLSDVIESLDRSKQAGDPDIGPGLHRVRELMTRGVRIQDLPNLRSLLDSLVSQGAN